MDEEGIIGKLQIISIKGSNGLKVIASDRKKRGLLLGDQKMQLSKPATKKNCVAVAAREFFWGGKLPNLTSKSAKKNFVYLLQKWQIILFHDKNINRTFFARLLNWCQRVYNLHFFAKVAWVQKSVNFIPKGAIFKKECKKVLFISFVMMQFS